MNLQQTSVMIFIISGKEYTSNLMLEKEIPPFLSWGRWEIFVFCFGDVLTLCIPRKLPTLVEYFAVIIIQPFIIFEQRQHQNRYRKNGKACISNIVSNIMYLISFCRYVYKRYNRAVQYAFTFAVKKETPKRRVRVFPIFSFY